MHINLEQSLSSLMWEKTFDLPNSYLTTQISTGFNLAEIALETEEERRKRRKGRKRRKPEEDGREQVGQFWFGILSQDTEVFSNCIFFPQMLFETRCPKKPPLFTSTYYTGICMDVLLVYYFSSPQFGHKVTNPFYGCGTLLMRKHLSYLLTSFQHRIVRHASE